MRLFLLVLIYFCTYAFLAGLHENIWYRFLLKALFVIYVRKHHHYHHEDDEDDDDDDGNDDGGDNDDDNDNSDGDDVYMHINI
jgi:Ca2+/Na+ antiporter